MAIKWGIDLTPEEATDVENKPKALPYWLRVNLRKPAEKGAPGLHRVCFFYPNSEAVYISLS